jgi:Tol biopolymer transport system component
MVTDPVFSPDGTRIAAAVKDRGRWSLAADGRFWQNAFDMVFKPVFSPNGQHLAAAAQRNGKFTVAVDDRPWPRDCDMVWDPVFSPDSERILLRTIEGGTYFRRVMPVAEITG